MEKNFKYSININQFAVVKHGLKLDLIDCALFDYLKDFAHCDKISKTFSDGKSYFYIKWNKIVDDMPMLGINTRKGIIARINNLIDSKLLERHPDNQTNGQSMFCFGENYLKMVAFSYIPVTQNTDPVTENTIPDTIKLQDTVINDDFEPKIPVTQNTDLSPTGNTPVTDGYHYNSINYNSIKSNVYNSLKEKEKFEKKSEKYILNNKWHFLSVLNGSAKFNEMRVHLKEFDNIIFSTRCLDEVSISEYSDEHNMIFAEKFINDSILKIGCDQIRTKEQMEVLSKSIVKSIVSTQICINWSEMTLATEIAMRGLNHPCFDEIEEFSNPTGAYNLQYFIKVLKMYIVFRNNLDRMISNIASGLVPYKIGF